MRTLFLPALLAALVAAVTPANARETAPPSAAPTPDGVLRVTSPEAAIALAMERSPTLGAAQAGVRASRGELRQAGLRPNPELQLSNQNNSGSGPYRGGRPLETSVGLSQRLEIGGQRAARATVAAQDVTLAGRDLAAAQLDLVRDVRTAYAQAVAARRTVDIEQERQRLAEEVLRATRERVRAGREAPAQALRAEAALSAASIARDRAQREAAVARRALAVLLAAEDVDLVGRAADTWFTEIGPAPAATGRRPTANPDYARLDEAVSRARAALDLERRRAIPDVTVNGSVSQYREASATANDTAFMVGVSVPLQLFDRNQGNIARAGADLTRTELASQQTRRTLEASLADASQRYEAAWREADALRRTSLPVAERASGYAREGYREGKFSLLEVLDAQRTLFEARGQLNDALREVHTRRAEVDRLSGGPLIGPMQPTSPGGRP
ncbi:TolC family protein [Belnapia rosea]|uniref:TolC family protein n=1 Tax=Belnapia rosea TaxID=938405 RepID=UPI00088AE9A3|nr:TolC family protein [Belnapia rosea]SDB71678.1 outer membrane protein, cobalt-zinc-cadmium efflux system [Belnapia rosea]